MILKFMSTTELENILRTAPQPRPPANLQQRLKAQALNAPRLSSPAPLVPSQPSSWLARWWPVLAPSLVSLACAATVAVQQNEIRHLRTELDTPSAVTAGTTAQAAPSKPGTATANATLSEADELTRLRNLVASLTSEVAKLEQTRAENERLRAQLATRSSGAFTPEETKALDEARDKALNIQCVNNLKQLGLAVRVWSMDNHDLSPPNILSMSNEIGSFKILVCPADTGRQPAADPASFTPANCSYEYLAPSAPDSEPQRIAFRCPIHGNLGLIDGSVQSGIAKNHPNWIVQRDGKYYMDVPAADLAPSNPAPEPANQNQ